MWRGRNGKEEESDLHITRPPIEVQVEVFNLSILCKFVRDIVFCSFLVDISDHNNPPFDSCRMYPSQNRVV